MSRKTFYRRRLPHYQPPGAMFFVTFRLAGSLPTEVIIRLKQEQENLEKLLKGISDRKEREKILHKSHRLNDDAIEVGQRDSSPYVVTNIVGNLRSYTALKCNLP